MTLEQIFASAWILLGLGYLLWSNFYKVKNRWRLVKARTKVVMYPLQVDPIDHPERAVTVGSGPLYVAPYVNAETVPVRELPLRIQMILSTGSPEAEIPENLIIRDTDSPSVREHKERMARAFRSPMEFGLEMTMLLEILEPIRWAFKMKPAKGRTPAIYLGEQLQRIMQTALNQIPSNILLTGKLSEIQEKALEEMIELAKQFGAKAKNLGVLHRRLPPPLLQAATIREVGFAEVDVDRAEADLETDTAGKQIAIEGVVPWLLNNITDGKRAIWTRLAQALENGAKDGLGGTLLLPGSDSSTNDISMVAGLLGQLKNLTGDKK